MASEDIYDNAKQRVVELWQDERFTADLSRVHWMASPIVCNYLNRLASGHPGGTWLMYLIERWAKQRMHRILVLGCGDGWLERSIAAHPLVERIDAFDVAEGAVARADDEAKRQGLDKIRYGVLDLNRNRIPEGPYELIIAHSVIHHVENLDLLYDGLREALVDDGLFLVNEYVGPRRFQFTDRQIEIINRLFRAFPDSYRTGVLTRAVYPGKLRPSVEEMIANDPSEAVRSDEIVSYTRKNFEILETLHGGGTILMHLLYDVIQNFDEKAPENRAMLEMLCRTEEILIRDAGLPSDYRIMAASRSRLEPRDLDHGPYDPWDGADGERPFVTRLGRVLNRIAPRRPILGPPGSELDAVREGHNLQTSGNTRTDWIRCAVRRAEERYEGSSRKLQVLVVGAHGAALAAHLQKFAAIELCTVTRRYAPYSIPFDLIFSLGELGSSDDPEKLSRDLAAMLEPGGRLVAIESVGRELSGRGLRFYKTILDMIPARHRRRDPVSLLRAIKARTTVNRYGADELAGIVSRSFEEVEMEPVCSRLTTSLLASCRFSRHPRADRVVALQRLIVAIDRVLLEEGVLDPAVVVMSARRATHQQR